MILMRTMKDTHQAPARKPSGGNVVCVIDDDTSVRTALERLLISAGMRARTFASAREFLDAGVPFDIACVITDVKMQGMSGLELQQVVCTTGAQVPFIFVTAYDTDTARAEAKAAGAIAYFRKPVDDQALMDAIEWALSRTG